VSSFSSDHLAAAWARPRLQGRTAEAFVPSNELDFRVAALRVGFWLGWASILAVLGGLTLDLNARNRWLLAGATLAAAVGNGIAGVIPWRDWLFTRRGRILLDVWCGGLIVFVAVLVAAGGSSFTLLLFLSVPFIAVVQSGRRRVICLALSAGACAVAAALVPLAPGATAMRLALVGSVAAIALVLARSLQREAAARSTASQEAELARAFAREASHRIKNDLQTAADLLLLDRPPGTEEGSALDESAARIRAIASVHRLLTEREDVVDAAALLRSVTGSVPASVTVHAEPAPLDPGTARKLGIVANELVTNAYRHGVPPIVVDFSVDEEARLRVDDHGSGAPRRDGFGLELVRTMVEHGLGGSFDLRPRPGGGTRAEVVFPPDA
jgi:two-component sensor histidine kinase